MSEPSDTSSLSVISSNASKLMDAWRASRLNPTQRKLRKYEVLDKEGYLSAFGVRMYLDYLFQNDVKAQEDIAKSLDALYKESKKEKDEK